MQLLLLIFAIVAIVAGLLFAFAGSSPSSLGYGSVTVILGLLIIAGLSTSTVPTRNVGIVTSFSKPTGKTTGAGLKWHAPWQQIDDWDASGQTFAHLGDGCVWVTIAAQRSACIPVQVEWSARAENAPENWAAYREVDGKTRFETWTSRRVDPQINASLTSVFAFFDPLASTDKAPDLNAAYTSPLRTAITQRLGQDVTVKSIAFGRPTYDTATTQAIEAYGAKILEGRNLTEDKRNAITRAEITSKNASVDKVTRCLEIAEKNGGQPGLCLASGNTAVLIQGK